MEKRSKRETWKAMTCATALAAAITATPALADYYWIGDSGADLATASNWSETEGGSACESVTINSNANLIFPSNASVTMSANCNAGVVTFNGDVTFTSSTSNSACYLNLTQSTAGKGKITLDGKVYLRAASGDITIANPICISGTSGENGLRPNYNYEIALSGALSGSGTLLCKQGNYPSDYSSSFFTKVSFKGDLSEFTGTGKLYVDNAKCNAQMWFDGPTDMSLSKWEIHVSNGYVQIPKVREAQFPFQNASTTYKFGALRAYLPGDLVTSGNLNNITLELGEKVAEDSYLAGTWGGVSGAAIVWKASANTLTNDCANTASITVSNGGTVYFPSSAGIPATLSFTENGGVTVADIDLISSVTNVLDIASGKTVTITLKDWFSFEVTAENLADSSWDWREHVTALSGIEGIEVWGGGATGTCSTEHSAKFLLVTNTVTLTISNKYNLKGGCFLYDVTFKQSNPSLGSSSFINLYGDYFGPGRIIYDTVQIRTASGTANIYNDVVVASGTTLLATHSGKTTRYYGAVSGQGTFSVKEYSTSGNGYNIFAGDMSGFTGTISTDFRQSGSYVQFTDAATNLVNATVVLGTTGNGTALCGSAGTYTFGSLSGKVTGGSEAVTIVTGSGDTQATNIAYTAGSAAWSWVKQGSYALNLNQGNFSSLGTVTVKGDGNLVATSSAAMTENTNYTLGLATKLASTSDKTYTFSKDSDSTTSVTEDEVEIAISNSWIIANATDAYTASDLTAERTTGNKLTYWESYALGLTPSSEDSVPKVAEPTVGENGVMTFSGVTNVTVPSGVKATVTMKAYTDPDGDAEDSPAEIGANEIVVTNSGASGSIVLTPSSMTSNAKYYRYNIAISATSN